jgi:hypothetical protein
VPTWSFLLRVGTGDILSRRPGGASFLPAAGRQNPRTFSQSSRRFAQEIDGIRARWQDNKHLFIMGWSRAKFIFDINCSAAGMPFARQKLQI